MTSYEILSKYFIASLADKSQLSASASYWRIVFVFSLHGRGGSTLGQEGALAPLPDSFIAPPPDSRDF